MLSTLNPFHWKSTIGAVRHALDAHDKMNDSHKLNAKFARDVYHEPGDRHSIEGFNYQKNMSDRNSGVYLNDPDLKLILALKGTSNFADIGPDLFIIGGNEDNSRRFTQSLKKYDQVKNKFPNHKIEVVGHSLGGTQAMFVGQKRDVENYAYNPGFNATSDDVIKTDHPKTNIVMVQGDPISNTIMVRDLNEKTVILPSVSVRPSKNHSIDNFQT